MNEDTPCNLAREMQPGDKSAEMAKRNPTVDLVLVVLVCWHFDLRPLCRFPWLCEAWEWLGLAVFALLLLVALWRLTLFCGRAMRRQAAPALDPFLDAFVVPCVGLATAAFSFYPGDLPQRKSFAEAIMLIYLTWGHVIRWLGCRARAGALLWALHPPLPIVIPPGLVLLFAGICDALMLTGVSNEPAGLLLIGVSQVHSLSAVAYLFLFMATGIELREKGCVTFFRFVGWSQIESYNWTWSGGVLQLRINLPDARMFLETMVDARNKAAVNRILVDHLPLPACRGALDAEVDLASLEGHAIRQGKRKALEQVQVPAVFLLISGLVQIAFAAFYVIIIFALIGDPAQSVGTTRGMVALCVTMLTVLSTLLGIIVFAGALKMDKLRNYRQCRMACILAMMPTGAGFVFGLPFGLWGLVALRRPDVQAAFAVNDR
jgi:hypothetical protein